MKKRKIEVPLQNGKELKPIMIKPNMGKIIKPMAKFPDLSGDGKVTKKDILIGKGVVDKPKYYGDKPKMYGKKPKMYNKPNMKKGKHSLGKDVVAEYAKKGISEKILNTFGTTSSDTVTVKSRNHRGINPRAGAALKLSGKKSGTVKGLYSSGKEIMTRGQGKKEKIAYAMGDRTYTQDNKKELAGKVMMYKSKPKMYNKPKYYGKKKK